jgi:hypothetical protein
VRLLTVYLRRWYWIACTGTLIDLTMRYKSVHFNGKLQLAATLMRCCVYTQVAFEDRASTYQYGKQFVPVGAASADNFKLISHRCVKFLGTISRKKILRHWFISSKYITSDASANAVVEDHARSKCVSEAYFITSKPMQCTQRPM